MDGKGYGRTRPMRSRNPRILGLTGQDSTAIELTRGRHPTRRSSGRGVNPSRYCAGGATSRIIAPWSSLITRIEYRSAFCESLDDKEA